MAALGKERIFFDTTVLLAGLIDMGESSRAAQQIMDMVAGKRLGRPRTAWHCCLEFFAVATRLPEDLRLSTEDAARLVDEEICGRLRIEQLPCAELGSVIQQAVADGVVGGRVYDLHIAQVARAAGCRLVVTDNRRHFSSLLRDGIRVLTTTELRDSLER